MREIETPHGPARVELRTGLEVHGATPEDPELAWWEATERGSGRKVAHVYRRWGFTPLPPGDYVLTVRPYGVETVAIEWGPATVPADSRVTPVPPVKVPPGPISDRADCR